MCESDVLTHRMAAAAAALEAERDNAHRAALHEDPRHEISDAIEARVHQLVFDGVRNASRGSSTRSTNSPPAAPSTSSNPKPSTATYNGSRSTASKRSPELTWALSRASVRWAVGDPFRGAHPGTPAEDVVSACWPAASAAIEVGCHTKRRRSVPIVVDDQMRAGQLDEMDIGERCDHCGEVAVDEFKEFVVRDVAGGDDQEAPRYAAEKVRVSEIPVLRDDDAIL